MPFETSHSDQAGSEEVEPGRVRHWESESDRLKNVPFQTTRCTKFILIAATNETCTALIPPGNVSIRPASNLSLPGRTDECQVKLKNRRIPQAFLELQRVIDSSYSHTINSRTISGNSATAVRQHRLTVSMNPAVHSDQFSLQPAIQCQQNGETGCGGPSVRVPVSCELNGKESPGLGETGVAQALKCRPVDSKVCKRDNQS